MPTSKLAKDKRFRRVDFNADWEATKKVCFQEKCRQKEARYSIVKVIA
jgi:hypothetical protein